MPDFSETPPSEDRRGWLRLFAISDTEQLRDAVKRFPTPVETKFLRQPEIGLAMVRGRAGGAGNPFNLGEMSVTRCVVMASDSVNGDRIDGIGMVSGRDKEKAELVAKLDVAFQDSGTSDDLRRDLLVQLETARNSALAANAAKTAATKVEFFTMERGSS